METRELHLWKNLGFRVRPGREIIPKTPSVDQGDKKQDPNFRPLRNSQIPHAANNDPDGDTKSTKAVGTYSHIWNDEQTSRDQQDRADRFNFLNLTDPKSKDDKSTKKVK